MTPSVKKFNVRMKAKYMDFRIIENKNKNK